MTKCTHDEVKVDICRNYTDDGFDVGVTCAKCGESLTVVNEDEYNPTH